MINTDSSTTETCPELNIDLARWNGKEYKLPTDMSRPNWSDLPDLMQVTVIKSAIFYTPKAPRITPAHVVKLR